MKNEYHNPHLYFLFHCADDKPKNIKVLSLGQGQGPAAEEAIMEASTTGKVIDTKYCWERGLEYFFIDQDEVSTTEKDDSTGPRK